MRINIIHANLIEANGDAIVNSADSSLLGGGGIDGAIHQAAGPELLEECRALGGCETGRAKVTGAYGLGCKYIIHTVVPTWKGGLHGEGKKLASCYRASLELALERGCESIAFPLLGTGSRGYPKDRALRIALKTIDAFLSGHEDSDLHVDLMIQDRSDYQISPRLFQKVAAHLNRRCLLDGPWRNAEPAANPSGKRRGWTWIPPSRNPARGAGWAHVKIPKQRTETARPEPSSPEDERTCTFVQEPPTPPAAGGQAPSASSQQPPVSPSAAPPYMPSQQMPSPQPKIAQSVSQSYSGYSPSPTSDLDAMLRQLDEGFSQTLLRLIDAKGMTDAQCYKRANIDRRLFSRIRSNPTYCPSKPTVLAFAVALELTLDETETLLRRAGFALSPARPFDVIVEFFISQRYFNVLAINQTLFAYDQPLLGGDDQPLLDD